MPASSATPGYGTLLKRGDGGVGAGAIAAVNWGTTIASIRIKWGPAGGVAGTAGNGKNITVIVSGASFVLTAIDATQVSITAPTTATVAMVIAWLYQQAAFAQYWSADYNGVGDGTGTITAKTITATSGGTAGTEVFTSISEARDFGGPERDMNMIEVTHSASVNGAREFIGGLKDLGSVNFTANFLNDTGQQAIMTDYANKTLRNFQLVFIVSAGTVTYSFAAYVQKISPSFKISAQLELSLTFKISGDVTETRTY